MSDQETRKFTILTALVVGLLVAVIAQSIAILNLHRRIDRPSAATDKHRSAVVRNNAGETNSPSLAPDPFNIAKDSFDPGDWDPFKEMHSMQDRINQMFGNAFNRFQQSDVFDNLSEEFVFAPDINIEDKGGYFLVTVDIPGAEESLVDVKVEGRTLTISGSVQSENKEESKGKLLRQERRNGQFQRVVTLPSPVKSDQVSTTNKKGVLSIKIPKAKE